MVHIIEPRPLGYCPARNVSTMLVHQVHVISRHITATDIVSTILAITEIRSAFHQTMSSTLYQLGYAFNLRTLNCYIFITCLNFRVYVRPFFSSMGALQMEISVGMLSTYRLFQFNFSFSRHLTLALLELYKYKCLSICCDIRLSKSSC